MSSRNCSGFEIIEHSASCCLTFLKHDIYTDAEHSSLVCFLITFWITKKQHQNEILRKAVRKVCRLPYWTTFHIDIDLDVFERIDFAMTYIFKIINKNTSIPMRLVTNATMFHQYQNQKVCNLNINQK